MTADGQRVPDGFAEFVAVRSAALLRNAWLLTGDTGKAEDLLQTVLAKAWRRWPSIVDGGAPEAYVRRALFTTYVSWWRRRWRAEHPAALPPD
ncbi:MAG: sigma factor, partial [Natronosporangium sp.]